MRTSMGVLLVAALAGCTRSYQPPAHLSLGSVCSSNGSCSSGLCADGVCCERACAPDETCGAPGHVGSCAARKLGDPCDAGGQCPSTFCADGVCCESACDQLCATCVSPLAPGLCRLADENTDPRGDCPGGCSACFGGICGPALLGSNPKSRCGPDLACGFDGACRLSNGQACTADADCAFDRCFGGRCLAVSSEAVPYTTDSSANFAQLVPESLATDVEGDEAFTLSDYELYEDGSGTSQLLRNSLVLFSHRASEPWTSVVVPNQVDPEHGVASWVAYLGRQLYVIYWNGATLDANLNPSCQGGCNVVGRAVFDNGALGPEELLGSNASLDNTNDALVISGYQLPTGDLYTGWEDSSGQHVRVRPNPPASGWQVVADAPRSSDYVLGQWALGRLGSGPVFLSAVVDPGDDSHQFASGVAVRGLDGTTLASATGASFPCGTGVQLYLHASPGVPASDTLHFSFTCFLASPQSYLASLAPGGTLQFTPLPLQDEVSDNDFIDDPTYPRAVLAAQASNMPGTGAGLLVSAPDGSNPSLLIGFQSETITAMAAAGARDGRSVAAVSVSTEVNNGLYVDRLYFARVTP